MSTRSQADCPLCGKPTAQAFKPFCGQGCRDRDLLNWLGEAYRAPVRPSDGDTEEDALDSGRPTAL